MAPDPRVVKAFQAMKKIDIPVAKVKPVLKRLLQVYDRNWELIEEENYRVLADAIFEDDDSQGGGNGEVEPEVHDEPEPPLKRSRLRGEEWLTSSTPNDYSPVASETRNLEGEAMRGTSSFQRSSDLGNSQPELLSEQNHNLQSPQVQHSYKGKEPKFPEDVTKEKRPVVERPSHAVQIREPVVDRGKQKVSESYTLIIPKDEPIDGLPPDDLPRYEAPLALAVIHPDTSVRSLTMGTTDVKEPPATCLSAEKNGDDTLPLPASSSAKRANSEVAAVIDGSPPSLQIASSSLGEVKIFLSCNSLLGGSTFHMPSQDELLKTMQEKCRRPYNILDPSFSVLQMLKDVCESFLEIATDSSHELQERLMNVSTTNDVLKKPAVNGSVDMPSFPETSEHQISRALRPVRHPDTNGSFVTARENELGDPELPSSAIVPQDRVTFSEMRLVHDIKDITKGEELVEISWLNEINKECPPSFGYIYGNVIFQNAHVNFTLSQISAIDCCSLCIGDCLSQKAVCACASENGGKFAYASNGLLREDFLKECISTARDPQRQSLSYCKSCPYERSKNEVVLEPCKGHLKRKHINECWTKCSCHKLCGNRIVQRGIVCKLQVFFTPEGKGWGLRTLERLPKGMFVCEYVGEILTNKEFHARSAGRTKGTVSGYNNHPILLDAFWCLKGPVKDEEALCLDATCFGNVARFINHRCLDANLIEIPVKIDVPAHHYYHLAFFTTRDIDAMEELTWDYNIDFDENDHPGELFRCLCSSKFCRNMKRPSRSRISSR